MKICNDILLCRGAWCSILGANANAAKLLHARRYMSTVEVRQ